MSTYYWIMMCAAVVNRVMIFYFDCIFIKSLNFLSGRSLARGSSHCNLVYNGIYVTKASKAQAITFSPKCNHEEYVAECTFHECNEECYTQTSKQGTCSLQCNSVQCKQTYHRDCNANSEVTGQGPCQIHWSVAVQSSKKLSTITEAPTRTSEHYQTSTGE